MSHKDKPNDPFHKPDRRVSVSEVMAIGSRSLDSLAPRKVFVLVTFDPEEGPTSLVSSVHATIDDLVRPLRDAWPEDRCQEVSEALHAMIEAGDDTVHSPGPFLAFITHTTIS